MLEKVIDVLDGYTEVDKANIRPESLLVEDLGLNSVSYFSIVFDLEEALGIELPEDDSPKLKTVADLVDYLNKAK
ncbi:MAG: acyl carrier protein [Clostridia bacterium]|nr:acyl carrier protein [Clostridia bacterium]